MPKIFYEYQCNACGRIEEQRREMEERSEPFPCLSKVIPKPFENKIDKPEIESCKGLMKLKISSTNFTFHAKD